MKQILTLLDLLRDGEFHSGEELGKTLGISRAAIWKIVQKIEQLDIEIESITHRGYRIPNGIELLNADLIHAALDKQAASLSCLEIFPTIDSTNRYLLEKTDAPSGSVCLAEQQTAGRGRRGRHWVSPFGSNIYLSLLWKFPEGAVSLTGLSLVAGIAVARALKAYGLADVQLKWPNDVWWQQRKLAGILIEMTGEIEGPCRIVIGTGINVYMSKILAETLTQPWIDVQTAIGSRPQRNYLAALIIGELLTHMQLFQQAGLEPFLGTWESLDALMNQTVAAQTAAGDFIGQAKGIDREGRLLLQTIDHLHRLTSADVSIRPVK